MRESEWTESVDWLTLWYYGCEKDYFSARKSRLLAVAACRELQYLVTDAQLLQMLGLAEERADATTDFDDDWWERWEDWHDEASEVAHALPDSLGKWAAWGYVGLGNDDYKISRSLESVAGVYGCPAITAGVRHSHCPQISRLIREVIGNPFRPVTFSPL